MELGRRNDLSPKDAQAVLWFYEHNLFSELGIKNVPALYLSSGSKEYINNFDKGKNYGTIDLETRQPSLEITDRVVQKERASQEEEYGKLTEKEKGLVDDWESPIEQAPEEIKSTLLAEPKGKSLSKKEYSLSKPTLQSIQDFKTTVEKVAQDN